MIRDWAITLRSDILVGVILEVIAWATAAQGTTAATGGNRIALVIGISDYEHVAPLANPVRDAALMGRTLEGLGFDARVLTNATRDACLEAIEGFRAQSSDAECVFFYFAGHGVEIDGENYLIPRDANPESKMQFRYKTVPLGLVLSELEASRAAVNVVVLDACRDNPFASRFAGSERGLALVGGLAPVAAPRGTLVAYAADAGQVARDGEGSNGLYTGILAKNMAMPGLRIEDVFNRTREEVFAQSGGKQTPAEYSKMTGAFFPAGEVLGPQIIDLGMADGVRVWKDWTRERETILADLAALEGEARPVKLASECLRANWDASLSAKDEECRGQYPSRSFLEKAAYFFERSPNDKRARDGLILDVALRNPSETQALLMAVSMEVTAAMHYPFCAGDTQEVEPDKHLKPAVHVRFGWPFKYGEIERGIYPPPDPDYLPRRDRAAFANPLILEPRSIERIKAEIPIPEEEETGWMGWAHLLVRLIFETSEGEVATGPIYLAIDQN